MKDSNQGASLHASQQQASLDLALLVSLLEKAIAVNSQTSKLSDNPQQRPLFYYDQDKKRLRICTSGVLLRLFSLEEFRKKDSNFVFVKDFDPPAYGFLSRIGGQLSEGNEQQLPNGVDRLRESILEALKNALPSNVKLEDFLIENVKEELENLAKRVGGYFPLGMSQANLIPLAFDDRNQSKSDRGVEVAKIISAIERIDSSNYFQRMCDAIADELETNRGADEDEIDEAIASLEAEHNRVESQIKRFIEFLDNEALSRVRLNITMIIMEAIANKVKDSQDPNNELLAEYIQRIKHFVEIVKNQGLTLDLTTYYGSEASINFLDYIHSARLFSCLAVWPEWETQIFENRQANSDSTDSNIIREISYRFRINGNNPERGKSAFIARLERIQEDLSEAENISPNRLRNCFAELFFLSVVVPSNDRKLTQKQIEAGLQALVKKIEDIPRDQIDKFIQELIDRESSMNQIATALISILKSKGEQIISQVYRQTATQFICLKKGIVDWNRLESAEAGTPDLLVRSNSETQDKIAWLQQIEIAENPSLIPNLLFSIKVETQLLERNLVIKNKGTSVKIQRCLPAKLLQVLFVPCEYKDNQSQASKYEYCQGVKDAVGWALPKAIQIEYETRTLQRSNKKQQQDEAKQRHSAAVTAFAVLVYTCLWCIVKQLKDTENLSFTTSILRLQQSQEDDDQSGEQYIYAATQALESLLAQDNPTRMQGMVLENLKKSNAGYVKKGVFTALLSAFPIAISTPEKPAVSKLGLISYKSRPCDESPKNPQKNDIILSQSYIATAIETPLVGYELKAGRTQSDIVSTEEELREQRLIQEEIAYLEKQGCEHIILLAHSYRSRRINRTADYNTPLADKNFLQKLYQDFPDLTIYTLLRDVFPGTRMRQRFKSGEAAFEILRASDHTYFSEQIGEMGLRDIIPVYTFATLHAIDESKRPQSGFCVYFLLSDSRLSNINWTEKSRQHLIDPEQNSTVHPCLLTVLRGLHFIEAERGIQNQQFIPVLDPFGWISPNTTEAAGEARILHSRRQGKVLLSYPAILTRMAQVLRRRTKP
ncbi:hypothetical protein VB834_24790 [Limnoraphis robusta Tam1]|uniref:hypothetical protein n=1 Tax=Limnoraphis robusta TaxID=1118279 RepID=UPI002B1EB584|nr:hypothetical protein [Limnoraphis robusta]MEA5500615.1 hypothetical protein [Limnoraphis robusta BA-68 BA1]MEA5542256.1 hypothetical protein [Limnoraphis robusta Tam1]